MMLPDASSTVSFACFKIVRKLTFWIGLHKPSTYCFEKGEEFIDGVELCGTNNRLDQGCSSQRDITGAHNLSELSAA